MIDNETAIQKADLNEIKTMLTFCVRGERFCDGHWGAMIENGSVGQILLRLTELVSASHKHGVGSGDDLPGSTKKSGI
ncbi:MAG: hypothetical protein KJN61_07450 [Gammaproteobacteria bacterium]|nr:hypothetical protein [Gammaproteobacteria bacterium]MBT8076288.1 hypothetical protein [Gammaproteobacteria bacterium]